MRIDIASLLRPHLRQLQPYTSARDEYSGTEGVFLDANENPFGSSTSQDFNRYPDPYQSALKEEIAKIKAQALHSFFLAMDRMKPSICFFAPSVIQDRTMSSYSLQLTGCMESVLPSMEWKFGMFP